LSATPQYRNPWDWSAIRHRGAVVPGLAHVPAVVVLLTHGPWNARDWPHSPDWCNTRAPWGAAFLHLLAFPLFYHFALSLGAAAAATICAAAAICTAAPIVPTASVHPATSICTTAAVVDVAAVAIAIFVDKSRHDGVWALAGGDGHSVRPHVTELGCSVECCLSLSCSC